MKVTVMTRSGCHLCDEAVADLERYRAVQGGEGLEIEERNIETDDELHHRFMARIPVIMIGAEILSEFAFDPDAFEAAFARLSQGPG